MAFKDITEISIPLGMIGMISAVLYLFGYWNTFGINILQYAKFEDIVIATGSLITYKIFIPSFFGVVQGLLHMKALFPKLEPGGGKNTKFAQFFLQSTQAKCLGILMIWMIGLSVWFLIPISLFVKMYLFPAVFAIPLSIIICNHTNFLSIIKDYTIRSTIVMVLLYTLSGAYLFGKYDAESILDDSPNTLYETKSKRKYLGYVNGYFFLLAPDNSETIILRAKSLDSFVLSHDKSKNNAPRTTKKNP